jgi:hypothetical protein
MYKEVNFTCNFFSSHSPPNSLNLSLGTNLLIIFPPQHIYRSEDVRTSARYLFNDEAIIIAGEGQKFTPKYYKGKFDLHQRTYAITKLLKSKLRH